MDIPAPSLCLGTEMSLKAKLISFYIKKVKGREGNLITCNFSLPVMGFIFFFNVITEFIWLALMVKHIVPEDTEDHMRAQKSVGKIFTC